MIDTDGVGASMERVRGLFTSIDEAIGERPGVSNSYAQKHNIKVIDIWRPFVEEHFDEIAALVDPSSMETTNSNDDNDSDGAIKAQNDVETIRSFNVSMKKVLRHDLNDDFETFLFQETKKALEESTNFHQDLSAAMAYTALNIKKCFLLHLNVMRIFRWNWIIICPKETSAARERRLAEAREERFTHVLN